MLQCYLSGNLYAMQMATLRAWLRAKKRYVCVLLG
jgi:hypothetical protein